MSYDKLSLASFQEALKSGKYETATAAKRGVGRAQTLSDKDKEKARALIEAHFGESPKPAKPAKKTAKTAAAKKSSKKTTEAAPKKAAAKTASKTPGRRGRPPRAASSDPSVTSATVTSADDLSSPEAQINFAEKTIQNVGAALSVATNAHKEFGGNIDSIRSAVESMGATLEGAVGIFKRHVHNIAVAHSATPSDIQPPSIPTPSIPAPAANGSSTSTNPEILFRGSMPDSATP